MDKLIDILYWIGFKKETISSTADRYIFEFCDNDNEYDIYIYLGKYTPIHIISVYKNKYRKEYSSIEDFMVYIKEEFRFKFRKEKLKKLLNG